MNYSMIRYLLCRVLQFAGAFLTLPCAIALVYREREGIIYFILMLICLALGTLGSRFNPKNQAYYAREGMVIVSFSWIVLSLIGAIPFVVNQEIPNYLDAVFETVSGFTTTGGSIMRDVTVLSHCGMFWRLFTHWVGGMGVLVLLLAILPSVGGYRIHLMRAESPGPIVGKIVPKVRNSAMILYLIYSGITILEIIALKITGVTFFDSMLLSFTTVGTGGFGLLNDSLASYSTATQAVISVFMVLCGVNFGAYVCLLRKEIKGVWKMEEVRWYLCIILLATGLIWFNIRGTYATSFLDFHQSFLHVASIITTTGVSAQNYELWPSFSKSILFLLTLVGACAGSTGGGFKVSRALVIVKSIKNELTSTIHPKSIKQVHMDGKPMQTNVVRSILSYAMIYVMVYLVSFLILSLDNFDFTTNFTAVAACINNVGPGLSMVGPAGNYAEFSALSKVVLIFDMLAGRLEFLPMLLLFDRRTWAD